MRSLETASGPDGGDDWVAIPYLVNGTVVNHKYRRVVKRDGAANFAQDKGGAQVFWNADVLKDRSLGGSPLVITEGEFDALALMQAGIQRVVSVPGGAPQHETRSEGKYGFLADALDQLRDVREIVLAVDGDGPGTALLNDLAKRLGRGRCRYVSYPPGCKDMLEVLNVGGIPAVVATVQNARWMHVPGLYRMSELPPVPEVKPMTSGIPGTADHYRLRLGDLCVISGVPSCGKSTFVNDLACRMAEGHGWSTCFASFEQNPQGDHRRALRTWVNRKPEAGQSVGELEIADEWIDRMFSFVVPDEDADADLEWLLDKLASAVIRYDAKIVVIDPWNELDHAKPKDWTTTEYVGWAIRQLKKFARRWDVHLIVVAHPSKMPRDRDGKIPKPTLYDISDSAHWFNKPDIGIILHPKKDENGGGYAALCVDKSRYHDQIGRPGEARLFFNAYTARFEAAL